MGEKLVIQEFRPTKPKTKGIIWELRIHNGG
jgi:hypothetical protein